MGSGGSSPCPKVCIRWDLHVAQVNRVVGGHLEEPVHVEREVERVGAGPLGGRRSELSAGRSQVVRPAKSTAPLHVKGEGL